MLRFSALLIGACLFFTLLPAHAQKRNGAPGSGKFDNQYLLRTQNAPGIRQNYTLEETTTVTRTGKSGEPLSYKRSIVYYITQGADAEPQKGFTAISVNIDSMTYRMQIGDQITTYDSQVMTGDTPQTFGTDVNAYTAMLNRPFELTISPYGEVVSVKSEEFDWLKKYVVEEGKGVLDSVNSFIWLDGISNEAAANIGDVRFNLLPFTFVKPDSTWHRTISLRADGVDFRDTAAIVVKALEGEEFTISATADSLLPVKRAIYRPERNNLATVTGGNGKADISLHLSRRGMVQSAQWSLQSTAQFQEGKETFTETISKDYSLKLTGQFRW